MPRETRSARPRSRVQIDPDSPYSLSLAIRDGVVLVVERDDGDDRPEDLLGHRRSRGSTGASTVGGNQNPGPSGALPRKATGASSRHVGARPRSRCAAR